MVQYCLFLKVKHHFYLLQFLKNLPYWARFFKPGRQAVRHNFLVVPYLFLGNNMGKRKRMRIAKPRKLFLPEYLKTIN